MRVGRYVLPIAILALVGWFLYSGWKSVPFHACLTDKIGQQTEHDILMSARVNTECLGAFLNDNREAITAIATVVIALFTLTLWWATYRLLGHGRQIERAYVSGGGPYQGRMFILQVNNYVIG